MIIIAFAAIWSISAAPLIMGNDLRTVNSSQKAILLNPEVRTVYFLYTLNESQKAILLNLELGALCGRICT